MRIDKQIEKYVDINFPLWGINKKKQTVRLLYEIAKKDKCEFREILNPDDERKFHQVKRLLVKRRYPQFDPNIIAQILEFNEINLDPRNEVKISPDFSFEPKTIYCEQSVKDSSLALRIKSKFPRSDFRIIPYYKHFIKKKKFTLAKYNTRKEELFIIKEKYDFIRPCPCSKDSVSCGYYNFKLGTGCPYECTYCFLQAYTNSLGISIPANIDDFFNYYELSKKTLRLGSGQFTDSLVFDPITEYSPKIINFFRSHPESFFEFKTKSANIDLICDVAPAPNIIISWSLNPEEIIRKNEFYTASLDERLNAAKKSTMRGYNVGFHFDPIIYYPRWEADYSALVNRVFDMINGQQIKWISLGCLRMTLNQKQAIESRFVSNEILDEALIYDYDHKLRYPKNIRKEIFAKMIAWIRARSPKSKIYLCMEDSRLYECFNMKKKFQLF